MKSLAILPELPSLFVNREESLNLSEKNTENNVVSFYKKSVKYHSLPLEEKWKYRKAVNELQILINKIQSDELSSIEHTQFNLPEVVNLLKIRKEMLTSK